MRVYVFGNRDVACDAVALQVMDTLQGKIFGVDFVHVVPNADVPFFDESPLVLMDVVYGLSEVRLFDESYLDRVVLPSRVSVHDFDLGFQLRYLKKLGKLGRVFIIGLPMSGTLDYDLIHSILRKLVAHDMQGS